MINQILGWVPLIIYWTLRLSNADVDEQIMLAIPSFSMGIFLANLFNQGKK